MRYIFIIIIFLVFSCEYKQKLDSFCLKKIDYIDQRENLIPSVLNIQIEDSNGLLEKKMKTGNLKNVILYSIKDSNRKLFHLAPFGTGRQFKIKDKLIIIDLMTTVFEKKHITNKEIQEKLNTDIGLIFDKDTIVVKKCEN